MQKYIQNNVQLPNYNWNCYVRIVIINIYQPKSCNNTGWSKIQLINEYEVLISAEYFLH